MIRNLAIVVGVSTMMLIALTIGGSVGQSSIPKELRVPWHKIALIAFPVGLAIGFMAVFAMEWTS